MHIRVIAVGKLKERGLRQLVDEFYARIRRYVPCDEVELRDGKHVAEALRGAIPKGAFVVALEVTGKQMSSERFAKLIAQRGRANKGALAFLIGGADGLPADVSRGADLQLSLSELTFAHRVARVVLAEQLYRGVSIWRGSPYHRA